MTKRAGGTRGFRVWLVAAVAAVLCLGVAGMAMATNAAKFVAKKECQQTSGCTDYFVRGLHRVSRHKAIGKIVVAGARQGVGFACSRQVVIKLDHFTGDITYATSRRRCVTQ